MCSTFKGLLAAQILSRIDAGQENLTRLVSYSAKGLVFTSPVTKAGVRQGALTVAALCQARKILLGDVLSQTSRDLLESWMVAAKPWLLLVAAYYDAPRLGMKLRESVLREVRRVFIAWAG